MKVFSNQEDTSGQAPVRLAGPNKLTRYAFYGVIFAFPWETLDIGLGERFSLAKLLGFFFFGVALLQPKICFRFPPKSFWLFMLYFVFYALLAMVGDAAYDREIVRQGVSMFQMLVLFWLSYNVLHDERAAKGFLLAFISACISLPIGGIFLEEAVRARERVDERLVSLGTDPNTTGATFALAIIALLGLAYGRQERSIKTQLLVWLPFFIMAGLLIKTGSRGAMLSLLIGMAFFLFKGGNIRMKAGLCLMGVLGAGALIGLSLNSGMAERFEKTVTGGDTAGRGEIFSEVVGMVNEKPIMGWGPCCYEYEISKRAGLDPFKRKGPHNLYLKLLLEVGILGAMPFLFAIGLCFQAAWKARNGPEGSLPISMLMTLLMINMSITWDNRKIFWIILAYALVSARYAYPRKRAKLDSYSGQKYQGAFSNFSKNPALPS